MASPPAAAEPLRLILEWFVNPDHGPLIVAREKGFFARHGLEVEIVAPSDPNDPPKLVAAGQAELGISYQPQLHLQVQEGLPLARIGTLVATPLNTLLVRADGPIGSIADLKGRKIGFSVGGTEEAILGAILGRHGLTLGDVELVNVNFSLSPALITGQVDAVIGAYRNFELNQMAIEGQPGRAFFIEEEGVPAYDELIYIAHRDQPGRSAAAALPQGGRGGDALAHQPPAGGLGRVQGDRPGPRQRAQRARLARYPAALRGQPRGPRCRPLPPLRALPRGAGAGQRPAAGGELCRRPVR